VSSSELFDTPREGVAPPGQNHKPQYRRGLTMPCLDERFPALAAWTTDHGWIEVGLIEGFEARIQMLDEGGLIWSKVIKYIR
jgi:hypothetical protein